MGGPETEDSVMILPVHLLCLWELAQMHSIDSNACIGCETTAGDLYTNVEGLSFLLQIVWNFQ